MESIGGNASRSDASLFLTGRLGLNKRRAVSTPITAGKADIFEDAREVLTAPAGGPSETDEAGEAHNETSIEANFSMSAALVKRPEAGGMLCSRYPDLENSPSEKS